MNRAITVLMQLDSMGESVVRYAVSYIQGYKVPCFLVENNEDYITIKQILNMFVPVYLNMDQKI